MKLSEKKSSGDFVPHPETNGVVKAVLVDVTPTKRVPDKFHPGEEKEIFRLVYETDVMDEANDRRFCLWSRPYTPSLNEKANFRKDIKKILGRDLTEIEREEYDTDSLIGKPVQIIVQHEEGTNGQTYAVISFLGPDKSGDPLTASGKYVRVQDRESNNGGDTGASYRKAPAATEDEGRAGWQKTKVHVGKHAGVDLGDIDVDAVKALIDKWLPLHQVNAKPKADDKRLAAALIEVSALIGHPAEVEQEENAF